MKYLTCSFALPVLTAALIVFTGAGCGRDEVKVYHVDTNETVNPTPPPLAASGAMPGTMPDGMLAPDNSGLPPLKYTLPAGWKEKELTQMRVASFSVSENGKQADVSVIPMSGMAGGNLANVNRWRGQVGLQPLDEAGVQKTAEKVSVAGLDSDLFDISGTVPGSGEAERILATVLLREDTSWFFKMTGDSELVEKNKPAFLAFLKSVAFGGPATPSTMDLSQLPPSHPPIGGTGLGTQNTLVPNANTAVAGGLNSGAGDKPTWTVPAGWQEGQLAQFLIAKYVISGAEGATAAVNVSSLNGDGGGLLPNVNRWRAQLGLAPAAEAELANLPTIEASGTKATLIEFSGTDARAGKPARLVGAVLPLGGQTWFYKLMGDPTLVTQQKEALVKFVQSAKYPDAQ